MNFIQLSDLHLDDPDSIKLSINTREHLIRIMETIPRSNVQMLIVTGDIAEPSAIPFFYETMQQYGYTTNDVHLVFGNHDSPDGFGSLENRVLYYDQSVNGFHFLFLDTHQGYVDVIQIEWIRRVLSQATNPIVVFSHYPILDCGNTLMDRKYPLKNRMEISRLFEAVDLPVTFFCGHYHTTHQQTYKNMTQYICPSTFVQIKQQAEDYEIESQSIGYRMIKIEGGKLETETTMIE